MRLLHRYLPGIALVAAAIALLPPVASASWSGAYSIAAPVQGDEQDNNYDCWRAGATFGYGWDANHNYIVNWSYGTMPVFSLPSGASLVGALLSGSVSEVDSYGGIPVAGQYHVGAMAGNGAASNAGNNPGCNNIANWGGDSAAITLPGNTTQSVPFVIHAYHTALAYVNGWVPWTMGRPLGMSASTSGSGNVWLQVNGAMSFQFQWAYQPIGLAVTQVFSGDGTQSTVSWNSSGQGNDISYVLQRETITASGSQGFATIYSGNATRFTTMDQGCGRGYVYRVEAVGQDASTPWTTSGEWDEYPCAVRLSVPVGATNEVNIAWPEVTSGTRYEVVWCQSSGCTQQSFSVSPGTTTNAQLTGLMPNTEYTIWACAVTNAWGCPVASAWTYAAVPTLRPNNDTSGLSYDQQPFTWATNGNPADTVYDLQQGTFDQNGAWQGGTVLYSGTATTFTASQLAGRSYAYNVWAISAGYGTGTSGSNTVPTQVASAPSLTITGPTTATVSWNAVPYMSSAWVGCEVWGSNNWSTEGTAAGNLTSLSLSGLTPNTDYYCATTAVASNAGIQWWQGTNTAYTDANTPTGGVLSAITQTSLTAAWGGDGNPTGTRYQAVLQAAPGGGAWLQQSGWTTSRAWTATGLVPGGYYEVWVEAESGGGVTTAWTFVGQAYTVPAAPADFTATTGGLGWSVSSGRGYVNLTWAVSAGATGYDVWVWDGVEYEAFDVGGATSWDSRRALIYPPDAALFPNTVEGAAGTPIFAHNAGGLDLRDRPLDLYCSTGTYYCSSSPSQNYWIGVSAYNTTGNSASEPPGYACGQPGECQTPTLPLQTDPAAPTITGWSVNNGGAYTYSGTVPFNLTAVEATSGVAAYALSNDGLTWTTTPISGCTVGQASACPAGATADGSWPLLPGPGTKTVWARVESTAGVWSPAQATTVYVNVDQTVPTVDVSLNGGASSTDNPSVTVGVTVEDPVGDQDPAIRWQVRYSTDGGQTWSAWQQEGRTTAWSQAWTIPGGASGERTVLAQVENNDSNLGQGGGTIYYAAPGTGGGATLPSGAGGEGFACTWPINGHDLPATCVTSSQVTIPLSAPASAVRMRISLDDATWGPWQATASSLAVDLGSSAGAKTVWIQYQDGSAAVTADDPLYYVYDPAAPRLETTWAGNASATDPGGHADLLIQVSDDVGTTGTTVVVSENGTPLYSGPYENDVALTMSGSGYQMVQVTATDAGGNKTATQLGIYVQ